jgi:hypothetical protein
MKTVKEKKTESTLLMRRAGSQDSSSVEGIRQRLLWRALAAIQQILPFGFLGKIFVE